MREKYDAFKAAGAEVLEVSVDSVHSQTRWAQDLGGVPFPIMSDFHPKGAVATAYGVYNEETGMARRASFIIDMRGLVTHAVVYEPGKRPDMNVLLGVVADS